MAQLFKTDGTTEDVVPSKGKKFTLPELQKFVGGYIQLCTSTVKGTTLIVNEEGLLRNLPINGNATRLMHPSYGGQILRGDVLVCKRGEF